MSQTSLSIAELLDALLAQMSEQIVERVSERLSAETDRRPARDELDELGLEPLRAYSAKEVAHLLGIRRVSSVYEIPEEELPRVRRVGSSIGFLGINVLCYMHGMPPVDMQAVIERYRERLMQERPTVRPLNPVEGRRIRIL